ncbi:MAG: STAS domain-containing protein [Pleurocapsa sp.]
MTFGNTKSHTKFATFEPQGYLSAANAENFLERLTLEIKSSNHSALLVDMESVEFMDSAALMALIKAFRLAESLGQRIALSSLTPSVRMMFELTQLDNALEIFEDRDSFLEAIS